MIQAVLKFWFGDQTDGFCTDECRERWFVTNAEFDEEIRGRFGDLPGQARSGQLDGWLESAEGTLAYVIVTDQFPRNLFRGTADAFGFDHLALAAAREAVSSGQDLSLGFDERAFLYLPFEHSEDLVDQHASVGLFSQLRDQTPAGSRHITGGYLHHAHQHRDIVQRFGRFPHRNAALGRVSSEEEAEFAEGGGFGQ